MVDERPAGGVPAKKADGHRVAALEEEARRTDERLQRLERQAAELRGDVDDLAEATGQLRRSSAKMRTAAERVAHAVVVAAERRRKARAKATGTAQVDKRPPRTK